jgi:hypothetical protein
MTPETKIKPKRVFVATSEPVMTSSTESIEIPQPKQPIQQVKSIAASMVSQLILSVRLGEGDSPLILPNDTDGSRSN